MKKTGFKLLLSGVALAACAATLSTTTYAWYTSNTEVSASGMNGAIKGMASSGLLISKDGSNFSSSITFTEKDIKGTKAENADTYSGGLTHNGSQLEPLEYREGTKDLGGLQTGADAVAKATGHSYLQFSVYVKSTDTALPESASDIPVYFKSLSITNTTGITGSQTTAVLPQYNILSNYKVAGGATGWAADAGNKYSVDATQALNLGLAVGEQQAAKSEDIGATALSLNNYVTPVDEVGLADSVDALDYYNQIMHGGDVDASGEPDTTKFVTRPATTATETNKNIYNPIELAKTTSTGLAALKVVGIADVSKAYEIVFTVWLDGWDKYCFDACRGQSFSIDFALTSSPTDAAVYAKSDYAPTATSKQGA